MWWIIPMVLAVVCSVLSPYVGMLGAIFGLAELFFLIVLRILMRSRYERCLFAPESSYSSFLRRSAKTLSVVWCVAAVVLIAATAFVSGAALAVPAMSQNAVPLTPVDIFPEKYRLLFSIILFTLQVVFLILAVVLLFRDRKRLAEKYDGLLKSGGKTEISEKVAKTLENNRSLDADNIKFRVGFPSIVIFLLSTAVGALDPKFGWMAFIIAGAFLYQMLLTAVMISLNKRMVRGKKNGASGALSGFGDKFKASLDGLCGKLKTEKKTAPDELEKTVDADAPVQETFKPLEDAAEKDSISSLVRDNALYMLINTTKGRGTNNILVAVAWGTAILGAALSLCFAMLPDAEGIFGLIDHPLGIVTKILYIILSVMLAVFYSSDLRKIGTGK